MNKVRHKTRDEIAAQCKRQRLQYEAFGEGTCVVRGGGAVVIYNDVTGFFSGKTPKGVAFNALTPLGSKNRYLAGMRRFFWVLKES